MTWRPPVATLTTGDVGAFGGVVSAGSARDTTALGCEVAPPPSTARTRYQEVAPAGAVPSVHEVVVTVAGVTTAYGPACAAARSTA
ncbi:hypothetical protein [Pengzhenrongella sicca]|uniref:hypothetical protein n=1 Tax=Pengzhenrongella sicca TaxID=2819238 RepID=UPI001D0C33DD|nr:hypothetical protein [Pengzhenrongella sicca]